MINGWLLLLSTTTLLSSAVSTLQHSNDAISIMNHAEFFNNTLSVTSLNEYQSIEEDAIIVNGDIVMSHCEYLQKYQLSDGEREEFISKYAIGECANIEAGQSDENRRWKDNIVPYELDGVFNNDDRKTIKNAIQKWDDVTCLTFVEHTSEKDFIFIKGTSKGCHSSAGRRGGRQTISLDRYDCIDYGRTLHELGHALGFHHEQSRPDRDQYITIIYDNIEQNKGSNYKLLQENTWDPQGIDYDFFSVMHYAKSSFSTGDETMEVHNLAAYEKQGKPELGTLDCLSPRDILQMNRMYNCPNKGYNGVSMVRIKEGTDLNTVNPYIKVTAVDSKGGSKTLDSSGKDTNNVVWEEFLFFPNSDWQLFRISVRDAPTDLLMSVSRTYPLVRKSEHSQEEIFCSNVACTEYLTFGYDLIPVREGGIKVTVKEAEGFFGIPNLYVIATAVPENQQSIEKKTQAIQGNAYPRWNEVLTFDQCTSIGFFVHVWGHFPVSLPLAKKEFVELSSPSDTKKVCFGNPCNIFLIVSYEMMPHPPECIQSMKGNLIINIISGKYLSKDSSINAFVTIYAYEEHNGYTYKQTIAAPQNPNPTWNQKFDFGEKNWTKFTITVKEYVSPPSLESRDISDSQTWLLPLERGLQSTNARVIAKSGFVDFDYQYI